MNATPLRPVLYALTLSLLADASGYAAGIRALGGESVPGSDSVQESQSAVARGRARRDELGQDAPSRRGDTTTRGPKDRASIDRNGIQTVALHGVGLAAKRSVNASSGARSVVSKPAAAVAPGYLPRRPAADHRPGLPDPGLAAQPTVGAASGSVVAARASSSVLLAARQSATTFKPQGANGVIGGPRAAGSGSLGGPANSKSVINASINGSALRHRS
jgi:hypothetical protein